jgi:hypothetical protein
MEGFLNTPITPSCLFDNGREVQRRVFFCTDLGKSNFLYFPDSMCVKVISIHRWAQKRPRSICLVFVCAHTRSYSMFPRFFLVHVTCRHIRTKSHTVTWTGVCTQETKRDLRRNTLFWTRHTTSETKIDFQKSGKRTHFSGVRSDCIRQFSCNNNKKKHHTPQVSQSLVY